MADHNMSKEDIETLRAIIHEEMEKQRKEIFRHIGDAVGYDVGDPEELKSIRKDMWMIRSTRLRSDRFKATGERIFFIFFWGTILSALVAGSILLLKNKITG